MRRASFDMQCPEAELTTTDLGGGKTYGVSGCGKRATYISNDYCDLSPRGLVEKSCQWLLNTDAHPATAEGAGGEAPAAAKPDAPVAQ